jgi:hypothetical protein
VRLINGIWSSPLVELWSDDIDIGANGGIDGGSDGFGPCRPAPPGR